MIDVAGSLVHRGVETQGFVGVLALFMSLRRLYANDDFVRMYFFNGTFFFGTIDVDFIAGF